MIRKKIDKKKKKYERIYKNKNCITSKNFALDRKITTRWKTYRRNKKVKVNKYIESTIK